MTRSFALLFLLINIFNCSFSQSKKNKQWKDGPLTWDDFKEEGTFSNQACELRYILGYHTDKININDTLVKGLVADASMDRNYSWVHHMKKTDLLLRYNQVIFDIVEYSRRFMQQKLYRVATMDEVNELLSQTNADCAYLINTFNRESRYGEDIQVISMYELRYSKSLNENPVNKTPAIERKPFSLGIHFSVAHTFLAGEFSDYFTSPTCVAYGFDFGIKNHFIILNGSLGGVSVKKNFIYDNEYSDGERFSYTYLELSYGYCLTDGPKFRWLPYAGFSVTEVAGKDPDEPKGWTSYLPSAGVLVDYKLRKTLTIHPQVRSKELSSWSIRAKLSASYIDFGGDLKALSVNLSLGILMFSNFVQVKQVER